MHTMKRLAPPALAALLILACSTLTACIQNRSVGRVIDLRSPPAGDIMRRADRDRNDAVLMDTRPYHFGTLQTDISVEPPLEQFVEEELEARLGTSLRSVRVEFIGYRYAYYFPSRHDDFVLSVVIEGDSVSGAFEGVIGGDEQLNPAALLGAGYWEEIPETSPLDADGPEGEAQRDLERAADSRAYWHRSLIRLAVERIAEEMP